MDNNLKILSTLKESFQKQCAILSDNYDSESTCVPESNETANSVFDLVTGYLRASEEFHRLADWRRSRGFGSFKE